MYYNDNTPLTSLHAPPLLPSSNEAEYPDFARNPWRFNNLDVTKNPGLGVPYIGFLRRIDDRFGHSVVIRYCGDVLYNIDNPASTPCVECHQACKQKGKISSIQLMNGNATLWTLVYTYRLAHQYSEYGNGHGLGTWAPWLNSNQYAAPMRAALESLQSDVVVDRIHVYPGSLDSALIQSNPCVTLHEQTDVDWASNVDPIALYNATNPQYPLPTEWQYEIRYYYSYIKYDVNGTTRSFIKNTPLLVATRTTSRVSPGVSDEIRWRVFWYDQSDSSGGAVLGGSVQVYPGHTYCRPLAGIFEDQDIRVLASRWPSEWGKHCGKAADTR